MERRIHDQDLASLVGFERARRLSSSRADSRWDAEDSVDDWDCVDWSQWWDRRLEATGRFLEERRLLSVERYIVDGIWVTGAEIPTDEDVARRLRRIVRRRDTRQRERRSLKLAEEVQRREAALGLARGGGAHAASAHSQPGQEQRVLEVGAPRAGSFPTIQSALLAARQGDEVRIWPGVYREHMELIGTVLIIGVGTDGDVVLAPAAGSMNTPVLRISSGQPIIRNLSIQGPSPSGPEKTALVPAVQVLGGEPTFDGVVVSGNMAVDWAGGGGVLQGARLQGDVTALEVRSGARPMVENCDLIAASGTAVVVLDQQTAPHFRRNRIRGGAANALFVGRGAEPVLESNSVGGGDYPAIAVRDVGTYAVLRGNQIDGSQQSGIYVLAGARALLEGNEIAESGLVGIEVVGTATYAEVRSNRIHDGLAAGLRADDGAIVEAEGNSIWANAGAGIEIDGQSTVATIIRNQICDGDDCGIRVCGSASPTLTENEIWGNSGFAIEIEGTGTAPTVTSNWIRDGLSGGITVSAGASPWIEQNRIEACSLEGILVADRGTRPTIIANTIVSNDDDGIYFQSGAEGTVEGNDIHSNRLAQIRVDPGSRPTIGYNNHEPRPG